MGDPWGTGGFRGGGRGPRRSKSGEKSDFFFIGTALELTLNQGCGVGRFFRIPTPTPAVLKNRLRLQQF